MIENVTTVDKDIENAQLAAEDLLILHYTDMLKQSSRIEGKTERMRNCNCQ